MAELRAEAGPSPNCDAVLVQIEHCANSGALNAVSKIQSVNNHLFILIWLISAAKIRQE